MLRPVYVLFDTVEQSAPVSYDGPFTHTNTHTYRHTDTYK